MADDDLSPSMVPDDLSEELSDEQLRALIDKAKADVAAGRTIPLDEFEDEGEPLARAQIGTWTIEKWHMTPERELELMSVEEISAEEGRRREIERVAELNTPPNLVVPPELLQTQVPDGMHNDTSTGMTWDPNETTYWSKADLGAPPPTLTPGCIFCGKPQIAVRAMGSKGALHGMCDECATEVEKKLGLKLDRLEPQA